MFSFSSSTITFKPTWLPSNKVFLAAFGLHFFNSAIQVTCMSFSNALFLSTYPIKWLPWLFIVQSLFDLSASYIIEPYVSKNQIKTNIAIYILFTTIILGFIFIIHLNYWVPFIYTLLINTVGLLLGIIVWSTARSALDVIEFKQISFWLSTAGAISSIIFGFLIAAILRETKIILILPWIIGTFILISSLFFVYLKPLPTTVRVATRGSKPIKYPLYRKLFITIFMITFASTFIDYCFRTKLAANFDSSGIAEFMAYYMSISNIGALLVSLFLIKYIINHFGATFLFYILPIYTLVFATQSALSPSIAFISILAAGKPIFYYGLFSVGREMVLNILPVQARLKGQFLLKTFCGTIACILASGVIFLIGSHTDLRVSILIIIVVNILVLLYLRTMRSEYTKTLDEEIKLKRFIITDDDIQNKSEGYNNTIKQSMTRLLSSNDTENRLFGLTLLQKIDLPEPPSIVFEIIDQTSDTYVKLVAIDTIARFHKDQVSVYLLRQLDKEINPEVIWHLFKAISQINPLLAMEKAKSLILSDDPHIKAGAIYTLLKGGNLEEIQQAINELKSMLHAQNSQIRQIVPEILSLIPIGNLELEFNALISDPDNRVSRAAIRALRVIHLPGTIPSIINHVSKIEGTLQEACITLQMYGRTPIPLLEKAIELNINQRHVKSLIIIFAYLPYYEVESFLIKLSNNKDTYLRMIIAKQMAKRTTRTKLNSALTKMVRNIILEEMNLIKFLTNLSVNYQETEIKNEINSRINLAKIRILYWITVYQDKPSVINIIPIILQGIKYERAKAVEYIDSLFVNKIFAAEIVKVLLDEVEINQSIALGKTNVYIDSWLTFVIESSQRLQRDQRRKLERKKSMDAIEKVFVLRKVPIFKMLAGELLLAIAEETTTIDMQTNQIIFKKGDPPDGIYIVVSGKVRLIKNNNTISYVTENGFFGELALLDNESRYADAIADTEGVLLFLDKQTFNQISDDQPTVYRETVNYVMQYLRGYLNDLR